MTQYLLALLSLTVATSQPSSSGGDAAAPSAAIVPAGSPELVGQLQRLRDEPIPDQGRGPLVIAYEKLIRAAGSDPVGPQAMMDLAQLFDTRDQTKHVEPDSASALRWYRRASEAAGDMDPIWVKSRLQIVWHVEWASPREAREILNEIAQHPQADALDLAQVESSLINISLRQGDLNEAETHARNLLGWYKTPSHQPIGDEKQTTDALIDSAATTIVDAIAPASLPLDARIDRIKHLMDDYPTLQVLQDEGNDVLKDLARESQAQTN